MPTLYDRTVEWMQLEALIERNGGELSEELEAEFDRTSANLEAKIIGCVARIKELCATKMALLLRKEAIAARMEKLDKQIDWMENYVKTNMVVTGKKKVEEMEHCVSVSLNPVKVELAVDAEHVIRDPDSLGLTAEQIAELTALIHVEPEHTVTVPASIAWNKKALVDSFKAAMAAIDRDTSSTLTALHTVAVFTRGTKLNIT